MTNIKETATTVNVPRPDTMREGVQEHTECCNYSIKIEIFYKSFQGTLKTNKVFRDLKLK